MTTKYQVVHGTQHRPYVIPVYNPKEAQTVTRIGFSK